MSNTAVEGLTTTVKGRVVNRGDAEYDEARALYNAMIDKHPAAIAYCVDESDVAAAIGFARSRGLPLAVRCGGHNGAGSASVDDGLVIDLSAMNAIDVDPAARIAARARRCEARSSSTLRRTSTGSRSRPGSSRRRASAGSRSAAVSAT